MKKLFKKNDNNGLKLVTETTDTYKGTKNKTKFPKFVKLCKATQSELKEMLPKKLAEAGYTNIISEDGYIYAKGDIPVLLTAHLDTVHKEPVKDFYEYVNDNGDHIISSPQGIGGDDRCGVYMILEIIKDMKPYVLFCEDEEIGGIGSGKFCKSKFIKDLEDLNFLIELDRANATDAVFYSCDNSEFTEFIENATGYKEAYGSFSDISNLAPDCGVAAVNLSCGYYHAHTLKEEVNVEEMLTTIQIAKKLLATESNQFVYIEAKFDYSRFGYYDYGYGYGYGSYGYGSYGYDGYSKKSKTTYETLWLFVTYVDKDGNESNVYVSGNTETEAWTNFFFEHPDICYNQVLDYDIDYEV